MPKGGDQMKNPNTTLQDLVTDELRWDPTVDAAHIGVAAQNGAVTLSGHVASYWQFVAAEKAARRVRGVVAVANELDVHLPTTSRRDDTDIAETLSRTLAHSISLPLGSVTATVRNGAVTLQGTVTWSYQREAAERIARDAVGISHVHNCITIKAAASAHDVEKDIRAALHRRANLDANGVHVAVRGNVATLTGTVSSLTEDRAVWWAASAAPGIERVVDQLVVRPALEPALA
jgi:osmotically-inducible protein OsmY